MKKATIHYIKVANPRLSFPIWRSLDSLVSVPS
jgi:hypothetical protein